MPALLERRQPSYVQEMEGKPTWKGLSEGFPVDVPPGPCVLLSSLFAGGSKVPVCTRFEEQVRQADIVLIPAPGTWQGAPKSTLSILLDTGNYRLPKAAEGTGRMGPRQVRSEQTESEALSQRQWLSPCIRYSHTHEGWGENGKAASLRGSE
ncbi:hypothetical protein CB1_001208006 [Camelus ferus]|nr:hypothetical protein CB1_001208006 [Camelus ferus]